jgi:hypothetical protein
MGAPAFQCEPSLATAKEEITTSFARRAPPTASRVARENTTKFTHFFIALKKKIK